MAFKEVYERFGKIVFSAAMQYVKDPDLAEEIAQQVFIRVWVKRSRFREVANPEDYLLTIARNTVFNHFRKIALERGRIREFETRRSDRADDPSWKVESKEYEAILQAAVDRLPPQQKQVYLLAGNTSLSHEEIALQMHLSKATVKKHLELARRFVRAFVNERLHPCLALPAIYCGSLLFQ